MVRKAVRLVLKNFIGIVFIFLFKIALNGVCLLITSDKIEITLFILVFDSRASVVTALPFHTNGE